MIRQTKDHKGNRYLGDASAKSKCNHGEVRKLSSLDFLGLRNVDSMMASPVMKKERIEDGLKESTALITVSTNISQRDLESGKCKQD